MNNDDSELVIGHTSSGAEMLARIVTASVAAAFTTVPSEVFHAAFERRERANRPSMGYYGDDPEAKRAAAQLVSDVGFDPVNVGPQRMGRYAEPRALLVAQIAYEGKRGPELAYRLEWLRSKGPEESKGSYIR